jgi:hypothetical protein
MDTRAPSDLSPASEAALELQFRDSLPKLHEVTFPLETPTGSALPTQMRATFNQQRASGSFCDCSLLVRLAQETHVAAPADRSTTRTLVFPIHQVRRLVVCAHVRGCLTSYPVSYHVVGSPAPCEYVGMCVCVRFMLIIR